MLSKRSVKRRGTRQREPELRTGAFKHLLISRKHDTCNRQRCSADGVREDLIVRPGSEEAGMSIRVLVVDDNFVNVQTSRRAAESASYEVATAMSGEAALEKVVQSRPDIVLLRCHDARHGRL